ncbi:two-component system sensor kinase/response regulator, bifunctional protein, partial [Streptomyces zinciresistens K42]
MPAALPAGTGTTAGAAPDPGTGAVPGPDEDGRPTGRRRALAAATERAAAAQTAQETAPRTVFALPPAEADRTDTGPAAVGVPVPAQAHGRAGTDEGRHDAVPHGRADDHTPPQPHPTSAPTGRRRRAVGQPQSAEATAGTGAQGVPVQGGPVQGGPDQVAGQAPGPVEVAGQQVPAPPVPGQLPAQPASAPQGRPHPVPGQAAQAVARAVSAAPPAGGGLPLPAEAPPAQATPAQGMRTPQQWPAGDDTSG